LVTHLVVTLIIGLGPTTIAASYDAMREMEAFAEETAVEFKKAVEEGLVRYQEEVKERRLQDDTIEKAPIHSEKVVIEEKERFDQNDVEERIKLLNEISDKIAELDKTVTGPIASETIKCSKTITGPTIRFPLWLTMYGLIGSLLIICGTTFVAIALLKGTKDNERV